ncbi:glutathione S-transferase (plasmid) [Pseudoalteromonas xiamenensis]|uniref:glutathione S-transferase family protein n=1 Tax=Pseudoalteromonas xiamenensis TaxID=882626 RepID=UPI0027E4A01F|nr:glutathione S-transferase [Pseudoalteromonas xiamenensis]WMN62295.1 glutathione S-transferase [Pseudoalteromonas xiamenensis]
MKLYDLTLSGNCYKVRLFAALAQLDLTIVPVDFMASEHKTPQMIALNPFAEIPILEDDQVVLRDAQAILVYLGNRYGGEAWWPGEAHLQGEVMQWLSVAANEIQHGPNVARLIVKFNSPADANLAKSRSQHILGLLNSHLTSHDWLAAGRPTIADCAVFPYVALAEEGDLSLIDYPNVIAWIDRVKKLPGYIDMPGLYGQRM